MASHPHLAFGAGIHHCVGAPLARMEAEVTFEHLLLQGPALALAHPTEPPVWRKLIKLRGLETLQPVSTLSCQSRPSARTQQRPLRGRLIRRLLCESMKDMGLASHGLRAIFAAAFVDVMLKETDANFILVDRRAAPGGHWNDAYPFVRLHQPSACYGVA